MRAYESTKSNWGMAPDGRRWSIGQTGCLLRLPDDIGLERAKLEVVAVANEAKREHPVDGGLRVPPGRPIGRQLLFDEVRFGRGLNEVAPVIVTQATLQNSP